MKSRVFLYLLLSLIGAAATSTFVLSGNKISAQTDDYYLHDFSVNDNLSCSSGPAITGALNMAIKSSVRTTIPVDVSLRANYTNHDSNGNHIGNVSTLLARHYHIPQPGFEYADVSATLALPAHVLTFEHADVVTFILKVDSAKGSQEYTFTHNVPTCPMIK